MVGVDPEIGSSVLHLWVAAGAAAALVAVCALAFSRMRANTMSDGARAGGVVLGAILGAVMTWALLGHAAMRDHDAERRTLETRAQELSARALSPGSALACLDAVAGDSVDAACEKALFASPAAVAAATSYAAARLELFADMAAYVKHGGTDIDRLLAPLRHSVEVDSYGFLAHALAIRDGCTAASCTALDVLRDARRVRANLSGQTLDHYLDRYLTAWAQPADGPVADAAAAGQPTNASQPGAPGQRKVIVNIDFPTSASIPAVSIMNPEPGTKAAPAAAPATAANPSPSTAAAANAPPPQPKKPRKQVAAPPPPAAAPSAPPQTLSAEGQADPVWTPAPPAPPAQAAATVNAPAANFASPR